jgi:hypothetical protein
MGFCVIVELPASPWQATHTAARAGACAPQGSAVVTTAVAKANDEIFIR